jgi:hypothetical protein
MPSTANGTTPSHLTSKRPLDAIISHQILRKSEVGKKIWSRFSRPKRRTLWYYRSLADIFRRVLPSQLSDELHEIVEILEKSG